MLKTTTKKAAISSVDWSAATLGMLFFLKFHISKSKKPKYEVVGPFEGPQGKQVTNGITAVGPTGTC